MNIRTALMRRLFYFFILQSAICIQSWSQTTNELQATVTPGYVFSASERLTLSKLNLLGTPMVEITGTVPGSALGTNTIGKQHIQTNVFDQVYLSGGNNATATIIDQSIIGTKIATNSVGGTNITDGTLTYADFETNWPKSLTLVSPATNDYVVLGDVSAGTNLTAATVLTVQQAGWFVSSEYDLPTGGSYSNAIPHSLGRTPYIVRPVLVCKTNDLGYTVTTELGLEYLNRNSANTFHWINSTVGQDSTNVYVAIDELSSAFFIDISTGEAAGITQARWKLKVYAW